MKLRYKKKQIRINLFFGILWLINGIIQTYFNDSPKLFDYIWFLLSAAYFVTYYYQEKKKYLTINNGLIKQNWPGGKSMSIDEIKKVKSFAGDLIIKGENSELRIYNGLIDAQSKNQLITFLKELNLPWE